MDDARWEMLEKKRERNRYFMELELAAVRSQQNPKKAKRVERSPRSPEPCIECGKAMRPHGQRAADFPGTVSSGAGGKCNSCYSRQRRGGNQSERRDARPENCVQCGWKLRSNGSADEHPGTRKHAAKGICETCKYRNRTGARPRLKRPEHCKVCAAKLRPGGTLLADYPDTKRHHGSGLCQSCFYQAARADTPKPVGARHDGSTFCKRCKVQLRSKLIPPEQLPGAKEVGKRVPGGHVCSTCASRERRGAADPNYEPRHQQRPTECIDCHEPMRPSGASAADFPGTKRHNGGGRCSGCWQRHRQGGPSEKTTAVPPRTCRECEVPLVSQSTKPVPEGARVHAARGLCSRCYCRERVAG